jgi:hypothetical protein
MDVHHGSAPIPAAPLPAGILAGLRRTLAADLARDRDCLAKLRTLGGTHCPRRANILNRIALAEQTLRELGEGA